MQNSKYPVAISRLCAVIGVASLVGCSSLTNDSSDARSAGRVKDDKAITESVEKKLKADPVYKFEQVDVKTYGGIVQLSGFVDNMDQSRRAEDHARSVGGVTQIINGLAPKPTPAPVVMAPTQTLAPTGAASGERLAPAPTATSDVKTNPTTGNY
jgi:hypothetical protein